MRRTGTTVPAMANCHSYFKQENGRITTQWPGYATEYRLRTQFARMSDYEFVQAPGPMPVTAAAAE
jgi:hypothetical protein